MAGGASAAATDCTYPPVSNATRLRLRKLTLTTRVSLCSSLRSILTPPRMHSTTVIAALARCTRSTPITLTRVCTRSFARRARHPQPSSHHTAMSAPAASASIPATGMPTWVKPLLRLPLPPSCTLQRRRGEAIWEPQPDDDEQAAQLQQSMQAMSLSSAAAAAAVPASSPATPAAAATRSPPPSVSKSSKSKSPIRDDLTTPTKQKKKQQQHNCNLASPPPSGSAASSAASSPAAGSSLTPLPSHTLSSTLALLMDRVANDELCGLEFDADVSSKERAVMHQMAEERQLEHESLGFRPRRHLYAVKPYAADATSPDQLYLVFRMGHLFLEGASLDALGASPCGRVDAVMRGHRAARDGIHYHVTLLHSGQVDILRQHWPPQLEEERVAIAAEAKAASATSDGAAPAIAASPVTGAAAASSNGNSHSNGAASASSPPSSPTSSSAASGFLVSSRVAEESLLRYFGSRLSAAPGPVEIGLGRAAQDGHEAFFRVVRWPEANRLRTQLGLQPADFHITVGFRTQDIHGVKKDWTTLVEPNAEETVGEFQGKKD